MNQETRCQRRMFNLIVIRFECLPSASSGDLLLIVAQTDQMGNVRELTPGLSRIRNYVLRYV